VRVDETVKYRTLPPVHLRHVTTPTSVTTTVGHEVDIEGQSFYRAMLAQSAVMRLLSSVRLSVCDDQVS